MSEAQEKRSEGPGTEANRISGRLSEALSGSWSYLRVHGSEASLNKRDLEALLDKLDEAKAECSEARAEVERLRRADAAVHQIAHIDEVCKHATSNDESLADPVRAMARTVRDQRRRIERLESAARAVLTGWCGSGWINRDTDDAMDRLRDLVGAPDFEAKDDHPQAVIDTVHGAQGEDHGEPGTAAIESRLDALTRRVDMLEACSGGGPDQ